MYLYLSYADFNCKSFKLFLWGLSLIKISPKSQELRILKGYCIECRLAVKRSSTFLVSRASSLTCSLSFLCSVQWHLTSKGPFPLINDKWLPVLSHCVCFFSFRKAASSFLEALHGKLSYKCNTLVLNWEKLGNTFSTKWTLLNKYCTLLNVTNIAHTAIGIRLIYSSKIIGAL
jgi:hypothetical protein